MSIKVGVLAFRAGEAADALLSQKELEFYERVGTLLTGERMCTLVKKEHIRTIPIPQAVIKEANVLFELASRGLADCVSEADILIVDLANPPRPDLPIYTPIQSLLLALQETWWSSKKDAHAFVLLAGAISDADLALKATRSQIEAGHLSFVDGYGRIRGQLPANSLDQQGYETALKAVRDDPLTLLKRKMMRRIGHFRHGAGRQAYATKYYYDGTYCGDEIKELLKRHPSKPEQIVLHAPISPWLRKAALGFQIEASIDLIDLSQIDETDSSWKRKIKARPLVLVPLVDSGRTLQRIHGMLLNANPKCRPTYQAVMSTQGRNDDETRVLGEEPYAIPVGYYLLVKQIRFPPANTPPSTQEHRGSSFDFKAEPRELTAYTWWSMIAETSFKEEEDVPRVTRKSLGFVPNFPQVLLANAPLLARKIETLLRDAPGGLAVDPLLICPDEVGAIELANCIRSAIRCSLIRIPRDIIDSISTRSRPEAIADDIRLSSSGEEWLAQLASVPRGGSASAILIDEFSASGETLRRLRLLCAANGINVERCVTLVDFRLNDTPPAVSMLSLYTLPLGHIP